MNAVSTTGRARGALRAELLKLRTLPAIWITVAITWAATAALSAAFGLAGTHGVTSTVSPLEIGLAPIAHAQAGFIVLGVLACCSEYAGGQIRTTLTAVPDRVVQHLAKTAAVLLFTVPVAVAVPATGVLLARLALGASAESVDGGLVLGSLAGASGYLVLTTLLAVAVAGLVRRTIPAVATLLISYFALGPLLRERTGVATYFPDTAGYALWFPPSAADAALSAPAAWAVVAAWTVVAVGASLAVYQRRDA